VYRARQPDGTQLPAAAVAQRPGFEIPGNVIRDELNAQLSLREQLHRVDIMRWEDFPVGITGKTLKRVFREGSEPNVKSG
jgi:long-chain acyl-CoA synthetase